MRTQCVNDGEKIDKQLNPRILHTDVKNTMS